MKKRFIFALLAVSLLPVAAADVKDGSQALSKDYIEPSGRFGLLKTEGDTLQMDFKKIEFAPGKIFGNIQVRKQNVLAAPAVAEITVNGKKAVFKENKSNLKMTGKNAAEAVSSAVFTGGKITAITTVNWDHTLKITVTVTPEKALDIDSLNLIFPLNLDKEKLLCGNSEPESKIMAGQQAAKCWVRKNITDSKPMDLSMWHNLWLGNTHYGLAWSFENLDSWHTVAGQEMNFNPVNNQLTIRLINRKTRVEKPLVYTFFMNITPWSKMPRNWREWRIGTRYDNFNKLSADKLIYWSFWRPGSKETHNSNWVHDEDRLKKIAAMDAAAGKARMFYFIPSHYTWSTLTVKDNEQYMLVDSELKTMTDKALLTPDYSFRFNPPAGVKVINDLNTWKKIFGGKRPVTKRAGERVCRLTDELLQRQIAVTSKFVYNYNIPGIYSDGVSPRADFTPANGAVKDDLGKIRPVYAAEKYMEMFRRIRAMVKDKDPVNGMMVAHNSSIRFIPALTLFDFVIFGEDFFYWYQDPEKRSASEDGSYYYAHIWGDIDNLKTEFHRQYGVPQVLLPEVRGANRKTFPALKKGTRTMLCYSIQFDLLYWPLHCDAREVNTFDTIRRLFGIGDSDTAKTEFIPYWENKRFIPNIPEVKVGYYEKNIAHDPYLPVESNQNFLLMVSNPQFKANKFTISVPDEFKHIKITDCYSKKILPVTDGKISLSLDQFEFTVLKAVVTE